MKTFNSRYLSCVEISSFFIPTHNFIRLTEPCHSILLGARGCGKTTMLKMLQPEANDGLEQKGIKVDIPFYGIYIPSDRQWSLILEQLSKKRDNDFLLKISKALVNLNVLMAFLETLKTIKSQKQISDNAMYDFCGKLIECWKINDTIPPIIDLLIVTLRNYASEIQFALQNDNSDYNFPYVTVIPFITSLAVAVQLVKFQFKDYELKEKWALCFDEMEIAPQWLQYEIINQNLRSIDQSFIFKLTSTPDWEIKKSSYKDASEFNDIDIIKCWNYDSFSRDKWKVFCDEMVRIHILDKFGISREELSTIIDTEKKNKAFYLKHLPKVDGSFKNFYMRDIDYDKNDNHTIATQTRNIYYNKIVLTARYDYYCKEKGVVVDESNLYLGSWILYNMADGNPRSLYNIINAISSNTDADGKLRMNLPALRNLVMEQSELAMIRRFAFYPMPLIQYDGNVLSYDDILNSIGHFFKHELLAETYNPKPRTMFTVENKSIFESFIHIALESGAIVSVDDKNAYDGRHKNGVYRLTYMLYPYFEYVNTPNKEITTLEDIIDNIEL